LELQIDAHIGGVNDIAFSHPNKTLSIITCGDDKLIKVRILCDLLFFCLTTNKNILSIFGHWIWQVWDAQTGQKQYTFEGHEAPVYSVCPHYKESIQVPLE
jgi:WD40 repeat protein